jgi:hypothetical protein
MSWQQAIPAVLSVVSAAGKSSAGNAAADVGQQQQAAAQYEAAQLREAARYEASQARTNAGQVIAASQRTAAEQRRQGELVQSRAIALAAAGGGSTTDAGVINLIAGNAGEIAYRSAVALYEGEDKARSLREQATAKEFSAEGAAKAKEYSGAMAAKAGEDRKKASMVGAFGDLIKGGASLFSTFGGGGVGSEPGAGLDNWGGT